MYECVRDITECWSQVKGLQFPGCHDPKYCRLVLHRSKLLMKPVSDIPSPPILTSSQKSAPLFISARWSHFIWFCCLLFLFWLFLFFLFEGTSHLVHQAYVDIPDLVPLFLIDSFYPILWSRTFFYSSHVLFIFVAKRSPFISSGFFLYSFPSLYILLLWWSSCYLYIVCLRVNFIMWSMICFSSSLFFLVYNFKTFIEYGNGIMFIYFCLGTETQNRQYQTNGCASFATAVWV